MVLGLDGMDLVQAVTGIVAVASGISAFIADNKGKGVGGWIMSVINFLALNIGKAKNDPALN